jgi:hypothetical protein
MVSDFEEIVTVLAPCDSILGRIQRWDESCKTVLDEDILNRAESEPFAKASEDFWGHNVDTINAELRRSIDDEDRGGYVLRLTSECSENVVLYARNILNGVEVHFAGAGEGRALVRVLAALVNQDHVRENATEKEEELK